MLRNLLLDRVLRASFAPQGRTLEIPSPPRMASCARWIRRWGTAWAFSVLDVVLSVLSSPRPSPLCASRTHAAPRRAGVGHRRHLLSGPSTSIGPTIHGEAHDTWGSPRYCGHRDLRPEPRTRGWRRRGPRRPCSAGEVDSGQNLRPRRSAHVVDAKAVDPAPLLEALADKHLTSFTTPRTTSRFCALASATSTAGPSPTHDAGGPGLYYGGTSKTANLQDLLQRLLEVIYLRFATSEEGYTVSLALTELVRRHPEIIRVGWRQRSQERSGR